MCLTECVSKCPVHVRTYVHTRARTHTHTSFSTCRTSVSPLHPVHYIPPWMYVCVCVCVCMYVCVCIHLIPPWPSWQLPLPRSPRQLTAGSYLPRGPRWRRWTNQSGKCSSRSSLLPHWIGPPPPPLCVSPLPLLPSFPFPLPVNGV